MPYSKDVCRFILQTDEGGIPTPLSFPVLEAARQANWYAQYEQNTCHLAGSADAAKAYAQQLADTGVPVTRIVPVGSIKFVNEFLGMFAGTSLRALNVPPEAVKYAGRRVYAGLTKDDIATLLQERGSLYVKPGVHPKRFECLCLDNNELIDGIPDDEPLFASTPLPFDIAAEWRLFAMRGRIVHAAPYILQEWVAPDRRFCGELADDLRQYPALAIDVSVGKDGEMALIEAHNFVACGLYGFEGSEVVAMLKAAWSWELRRARQ